MQFWRWLEPKGRMPLDACLPQSSRATLVLAITVATASSSAAACSGVERPAHAESASAQREPLAREVKAPDLPAADLASKANPPAPYAEAEPAANRPAVSAPDAAKRPEPASRTQSTGCNSTPIPASTEQLIVVTSQGFDTWHAQLQRYERTPGSAWQPVSDPVPVVLGRAGYAWGDGLHGTGAPASRPGPVKREGDGRSPAGVFALGTVHGYAPAAPSGVSLPYRQADAAQRCVDDPRSPQYNRIVEPGTQGETWSSAEHMRRDDAAYTLALDIEHNRAPVVAGHGSCIFAHVWANAETPVAGCTGMALPPLRELLAWIKPGALWVALPVQEYEALRACWKLPEISAPRDF